MASWNVKDSTEPPAISGYTVYDALGMRLGYVSGWITDGEDRTQMIKVRMSERTNPSEYLVPIGAITLINDASGGVQLRDLTKDSIHRICFELTEDLPEHRLLVRLNRHFPPPRAAVVERLAHEFNGSKALRSALVWTRLSEISMDS